MGARMKLIMPFVSGVGHESCVQNLLNVGRELGLTVEVHHIERARDTHYAETLARLWAQPQDIIIVEHDVMVTSEQLSQLISCDEECCAFEAWFGHSFDVALCCNKFSAALMREEPELTREIEQVHWRRLDVAINSALKMRDRAPHIHIPPVQHMHAYAKLAPEVQSAG
jgi:hypothetical protein